MDYREIYRDMGYSQRVRNQSKGSIWITGKSTGTWVTVKGLGINQRDQFGLQGNYRYMGYSQRVRNQSKGSIWITGKSTGTWVTVKG